jgi:LysR family transcriptional regulator, carnitine catabolism transcriptional activator
VVSTTGRLPRVAVRLSEREAVLPAVLAGAGVALVPASMAELARAAGAVVATCEPRIEHVILLVHRRGALTAPVKAFVECAQSVIHSPGR